MTQRERSRRKTRALFQRVLRKTLTVQEEIKVSQWAEKYRVLDESSNLSGKWSNSVTPYLVGIMDADVYKRQLWRSSCRKRVIISCCHLRISPCQQWDAMREMRTAAGPFTWETAMRRILALVRTYLSMRGCHCRGHTVRNKKCERRRSICVKIC